MRSVLIRLLMIALAALALLGTGCRRAPAETARTFGFDAFVPVYNRYITTWLTTQQAATAKELVRIEAALATAEGPARTSLQTHAQTLRQDQEKWQYRLALGDYLKTGRSSDVPANLVWENGLDQPEIGDPAAKKAGFSASLFRHSRRPSGPSVIILTTLSAVISTTILRFR